MGPHSRRKTEQRINLIEKILDQIDEREESEVGSKASKCLQEF